MFKVIITLGLAIISAILYRLGGKGGFKNAKAIRRFGCPAIMLLAMLILGKFHWSLLVCYPLMAVALSTYWDFIGHDNFFLHGFGIGLSMLPFAWVTHHWLGLLAYTTTLSIGMGMVSAMTGIDWIEETGRGFLIIGFIWMLLICKVV